MRDHSYALQIRWTGNTGEGTKNYRSYSRDHLIQAEGKAAVEGSSDPAFRGDAQGRVFRGFGAAAHRRRGYRDKAPSALRRRARNAAAPDAPRMACPLGAIYTERDAGRRTHGLLFTEVPSRLHAPSVSRMEGDIAFVFTGAAAAYRERRDLLDALPTLTWQLGRRFHDLHEIAAGLRLIAGRSHVAPPATAVLELSEPDSCGTHSAHSQDPPAAMIGLSSGETNSLFAAGAWQDIDGMLEGIAGSGMYDREIAGSFGIARRHWKLRDTERVSWINIRVLADAGEFVPQPRTTSGSSPHRSCARRLSDRRRCGVLQARDSETGLRSRL